MLKLSFWPFSVSIKIAFHFNVQCFFKFLDSPIFGNKNVKLLMLIYLNMIKCENESFWWHQKLFIDIVNGLLWVFNIQRSLNWHLSWHFNFKVSTRFDQFLGLRQFSLKIFWLPSAIHSFNQQILSYFKRWIQFLCTFWYSHP